MMLQAGTPGSACRLRSSLAVCRRRHGRHARRSFPCGKDKGRTRGAHSLSAFCIASLPLSTAWRVQGTCWSLGLAVRARTTLCSPSSKRGDCCSLQATKRSRPKMERQWTWSPVKGPKFHPTTGSRGVPGSFRNDALGLVCCRTETSTSAVVAPSASGRGVWIECKRKSTPSCVVRPLCSFQGTKPKPLWTECTPTTTDGSWQQVRVWMAWVAGSSKESGHLVPEATAEFTIHVPGNRLPLSRAFARGNKASIDEKHGRDQEGDVHRLCSDA